MSHHSLETKPKSKSEQTSQQQPLSGGHKDEFFEKKEDIDISEVKEYSYSTPEGEELVLSYDGEQHPSEFQPRYVTRSVSKSLKGFEPYHVYHPHPSHTTRPKTSPHYSEMDPANLVDRLDSAFDKLSLSSYSTRLPTFSGDQGAKGLMKFIDDFNEIGNIMNISEDKMARLLPAHLKGAAKVVFENFPETDKRNWRSAISKLKEHFSTDHYLDMAREKLMQMTMQGNESPFIFSSRIKREILDAYPGERFADQRKFLQYMIFTNGLSPKIKQKLKLLGPLNQDYDQLLRDAERMWDLISSEESSVDSSLLNAKIDKILSRLDSAQPQVNNVYRPRGSFQRRSFGYRRSRSPPRFQRSRRIFQNSSRHVRFAPYPSYHTWQTERRDFSQRSPPRNRSTSFRRDFYTSPNIPSAEPHFNNRRSSPNSRNSGRFRNRSRSPYSSNASSPRQRDSHRVNSIAANFSTGISASVPSLFILAIFTLCFQTCATYSMTYQLCSSGKSGWPVAFPEAISCANPSGLSNILLTAASVFVEKTEPTQIPAFHCFNKTRRICASSYLHISFSLNSDEEFMSALDPFLCQTISNSKKYLGRPLYNLSPNVFGSENPIHYSYPWFFGHRCTVTTNIYVEKGEIATYDGYHFFGQFGDMANCSVSNNYCQLAHGTIVWTYNHAAQSPCKYVKATDSIAYVTPNHVVLESIQSAFTYKKIAFLKQQLLRWCLPENAIAMDNGVFVSLPELEANDPRTVFHQNFTLVQRINEKHYNMSKSLNVYDPYISYKRVFNNGNVATTGNSHVFDLKSPLSSPSNTQAIPRQDPLWFIRYRGKRDTHTFATSTKKDFRKGVLTRSMNIPAVVAEHIALNSAPSFEKFNRDMSLSHEARQDQRQAEVNTKLQYLKYKIDEIIQRDFMVLFEQICMLNNFKTQAIKSIAKTDPTGAARILLNRNDISAISAGDVLMISKCKVIQVDEIYLDHKVNSICYVDTPVRIGKTLFFVQPGTRDLKISSVVAECGHLPTGIYNDGNNHYRSPTGYVHVSHIHMNLPQNFAKQEVVFNAPPIFHSDLANIYTQLKFINRRINSATIRSTSEVLQDETSLGSLSSQISDEAIQTADF